MRFVYFIENFTDFHCVEMGNKLCCYITKLSKATNHSLSSILPSRPPFIPSPFNSLFLLYMIPQFSMISSSNIFTKNNSSIHPSF